MNTDILKENFFSLSQKGINYSLDRISKAVKLCGNPHTKFRSIHVAGTNGKGSTCAFIESVLRRAGYKTGLFTSPQILRFEEQIRINGEIISEENWINVYKDLTEIINGLGLTFFETLCLICFEVFSRAEVDYAVIETGMGGRMDSTNIIIPEVSVITKIALDHKEYLGEKLEQVAEEKLGIVKKSVPLVMSLPEDKNIKILAENVCKKHGSELILVNYTEGNEAVNDNEISSFTYNERQYDLSLRGRHQINNALLALNALEKIGDFSYDVLYNGIQNAFMQGRFQIKTFGKTTLVLDAAHNPDAAIVLKKTLLSFFPGKKIIFIIGIMKDKDINSFLKIILKEDCSYYFTQPGIDRAAKAEELLKIANNIQEGDYQRTSEPESALQLALLEAAQDDIICITGSFYMVSDILRLLEF